MKHPPHPHRPHRRRGVALVLVLCFVVLITGLVVAYFSRTLTTRQLASASTSTTSAGLLADSATDIILGGLKQEIADPAASAAFTPPPGAPATVPTVYVPTQARYAVPQRNPPAAPGSDPVPNLVRRSLRADSLPAPGVASLASAAGSTTPSANGHSVSTPRWNRHYLVPTTAAAGGTISLTASTPVGEFTAPDWVFVTAEKGPVVLSGPTADAGGTAVTVTGRYAYAIYDEGGLLDINHTGYPSASTLAHVGAKPAPSYADLTQLGLSAANVDNLLGWRNYATLQNTAQFPGFQTQSASISETAYYDLFVSNPRNLLQTSLTVWNNKTDQAFLSRQQLVAYYAATGLDPKSLEYLGTFSRSLNQPSYVPETTRPQVLRPEAGGNDAYGNTGITPNFLTARVLNAFSNPSLPANPNTRFDGTPVVLGEPLVKKRFPLNRLAWLTCQGPSSTRNTAATALTGPDADIGYLKQAGITKEWLDQGTPDNIRTYFGLQWGSNPANPPNPDGSISPSGNGWTYVHGGSGTILNVSNPSKPTDVVRQNPGREPDFFELLKASINPGSIAKTSLAPGVVETAHPDPQGRVNAAQQQYNLDSSLDIAILQIGANIIDQFDTDGFPTRINYNFATAGAVYGVENLPYISRVRSGLLRLKEASPLETDPGDPTNPDNRPIADTGVGALMNFPEIWNPHAWSSNNLPQSAGAVGPSRFKVFARTNTYGGVAQTTSVFAWGQTNTGGHSFSENANKDKSPGFASLYGFSFGLPAGPNGPGGETRTLSEANTLLTFTIDPGLGAAGAALFREPTLLYRSGFPGGSQLASPALVPSNTALGHLANASTGFVVAAGGLRSDVDVTVGNFTLPKATSVYVGFYLGAHPLRWYDDGLSQSTPAYQSQYGPVNDTIYTLACQDASGAWIPYDTKAVTTTGGPNGFLQSGPNAGVGLNGTVGSGQTLDFGLRYFETVDPRTSRFGMMDPWISINATSIPPRQGYSFVTPADGTLKTAREGVNSGEAFNFGPFLGDPYLGDDWYATTMGWYHSNNMGGDNSFRPGLLSQNNPHVTPDGNVIVTTGAQLTGMNVPGTFPAFYYADPDGVARRASAGNVPGGAGVPASEPPPPNKLLYGLPLAFASGTGQYGPNYSSGTTPRQMDSRPVILNRPFRSVAELGYVYAGTPWKNLDFFLPESGDAAMLDVFCVSDNSDANALSAGQVNLNTHQAPVLQAILAQANKDLWNDASATAGTSATTIVGGNGTGAQAKQIAQLLVTRTVTGPAGGPNANGGAQPLQNVGDLVGRWVKSVPVNVPGNGGTVGGIDGAASYDGFTTDLANLTANNADPTMHNVPRFGESAVRALANAGQTRVWNLMFDLVAQTGRFSRQATKLDQFTVEGEQHYWVHVAIDRYTGQIVDKQVEVVKE